MARHETLLSDVIEAIRTAATPIEIWDAAVASHLEALLDADRRWRRRNMARRLIRTGQLFSRSR